LFHKNEHSPFGLCVINPGNGQLFKNSQKYGPGFLPSGLHFEVLSHPKKPYYPWTFHPPFIKEAAFGEEFVSHSLKMEWLTKLIFQIPVKKRNDKFAQILENTGVFFEYGKEYRVTLEFDNYTQGKELIFRELPLNIVY
jgi:hypothetical protein